MSQHNPSVTTELLTLCFFMKQQIFSHEVKVKSTLSECRAGKFLVSAPFLNPSVFHLHEGSFTNVTSAFEKALFGYSGAAVQRQVTRFQH